MSETKNNIFKRFANFVKTKIFYNVSKEEKEYVKKRVMNLDHKAFKYMLIIVFIVQVAMLVYTWIAKYDKIISNDTPTIVYLCFYGGLALSCAIFFPLEEHYFKTQNHSAYFIIVPVAVNLLFVWALGITVLDSMKSANLTTYAYTLLAICALITLKPWMYIFNAILYTGALNIAMVLMPSIQYRTNVIISSISIVLLVVCIGIINFSKRIDSLHLEKEVLDLNNRLHDRAYFDVLTKLNNRLYLTEHIETPINYGREPSGVIMFDIDNFKDINDNFGHQSGDHCLEVLGDLIIKSYIHFPNAYAVRYGGDEFMIFFPNIKADKLMLVADDLCEKIGSKKITLSNGKIITFTVSMGAAVAKDGMNYSMLISEADKNLYTAKSKGKNRVVFN